MRPARFLSLLVTNLAVAQQPLFHANGTKVHIQKVLLPSRAMIVRSLPGLLLLCCTFLLTPSMWATVFGSVRGVNLSNSFNLITDYGPGSWVTHDQLHVRGGQQVTKPFRG